MDVIDSFFNSTFLTTITATEDPYVNYNDDMRKGLELPMHTDDAGTVLAESLEQCIDRYMAPWDAIVQYRRVKEDGEEEEVTGKAINTLQSLALAPILQICPRRIHGNLMKLQHSMSFPEELKESMFVKDGTCVYKLFSVVVHVGAGRSGHNTTFINPKCQGQWYLFNDSLPVKKVEFAEVMLHSFGGREDEVEYGKDASSTAYILQYVRDSDIPDLLV